MEKNRTVVRIGGKEYMLAGYEPDEYLHRVAIYVDKKMQELEGYYINLSTNMLAVLAATNITDELLKERDTAEELQVKNERLREEIRQLQKENMLLKKSDKKGNNISNINKVMNNKMGGDSYTP